MKKLINNIKMSFKRQLDFYFKKCKEEKHYTYRNLTEQNYILSLISTIELILLVISIIGMIMIVII